MANSFHQDITIKANVEKVYAALSDEKHFAAFTDAPAIFAAEDSASFSLFGGHIEGFNLQLIPGKRVVQAWRAARWAEGVYSIVRFELEQDGDETLIHFDHTAVPEGEMEHLDAGWHKMYWVPLNRYLEG